MVEVVPLNKLTPARYYSRGLLFSPLFTTSRKYYCFGCSAGTAGAIGAPGAVEAAGGMASVLAGAAAAGVTSPPFWAAGPGRGSVGLNLFGEKLGLIS